MKLKEQKIKQKRIQKISKTHQVHPTKQNHETHSGLLGT